MTRNQKYEMETLINRIWKIMDSETASDQDKRDARMRLQGIDKALYVLNYRIVCTSATGNERRIVTIGQYCRMLS